MRSSNRFLLSCAVAALLACSESHPLPEPSDTDDGADADVGDGSSRDGGSGAPSGSTFPGVIAEPDDDAAFLFDQAVLREYVLDIAPADLASIDADRRAELRAAIEALRQRAEARLQIGGIPVVDPY